MARMTLSEFLGRFDGVKGKDGHYIARCPCHRDSQQSLSIDVKPGRDGRDRIMIHDHAGCTPEAILAAVGATWQDLVLDPDPNWKPKGGRGSTGRRGKNANNQSETAAEGSEEEPVTEVIDGVTVTTLGRGGSAGNGDGRKAGRSGGRGAGSGSGTVKKDDGPKIDWDNPDAVYTYRREDKTEAFQVVRYHYLDGAPGKTFRQRMKPTWGMVQDGKIGKDGWCHSVPESLRDSVIYNLPEVLEAVRKGEPVYVVEGEKDANTLERLGKVATTNAAGAGKWRESQSRWLEGADVIILPDNDPRNDKGGYPGQDHAYDVAMKTWKIAKRVRIVNLKEAWPQLKEKGDITDLIEDAGDAAGMEALMRQIAATRDFDPDMVPFWLTPMEQAARIYGGIPGYGVMNGCIVQISGDTVKPLTDFVPLPLVEKLIDNGATVERMVVLDGWSQSGRKLGRVSVPARELDAMNWVRDQWGLQAAIVPGSTTKQKVAWCLVKAGQRTAKTVTEYSHTGWREIGGKWAYLYHGGAIGAQGVTVNLGQGLEGYRLDGCGSPEWGKMTYREACGKSLQLLEITKRSTGIALLGTMFLCPLREWLKRTDVTPAFSLFLHGQTQTRKSTLAALAMSHFGNFHAKNAPANFKSTGNYITKKAFLLKDMPIWVDDFHPTDSQQEKRAMNATAQMLARAFGDGADRGRLNADRTLQSSSPPRSIAVITGEDLPSVGASGLARFFIVDVDKGDVPVEDGRLSQLQEDARMGWLQKSMEGYILWIGKMIERGGFPENLHKRFISLRDKIRTEGAGDQERAPEAMACILMGYEMMVLYMASVGAISGTQEIERMITEARTTLADASRKQSRELQSEKPSRIFLDTLGELLESRRVYVQDLVLADAKGPMAIDNMIGYRDNEYYYLLPQMAYKEVSRTCREEGHEFPVSLRALYKHLAADGIIPKPRDGAPPTKPKNVGGGKIVRVLPVPVPAIDGDQSLEGQTRMELRTGGATDVTGTVEIPF